MAVSALDRWVLAAVGAAFGLRVFDGRKNMLARAGYGVVALDMLTEAFRDQLPVVDVRPEPEAVGRLPANGTGRATLTFEHRRVRNIDERVNLIHKQMLHGVKDPEIYMLARKTLVENDVPAKDAGAEMGAMFDLVKSRVRYTWDPLDYDAFQTPRKTMEIMCGDCDDMVSLLGALLRSIGYKVRSRVVHTKGFDTWNHIYLACQHPGTGKWVPMDVTVEHPMGWEVPDSHLLKPRRDYDLVEG